MIRFLLVNQLEKLENQYRDRTAKAINYYCYD